MQRRWISLSLVIVLSGCGSPQSAAANENMPEQSAAPSRAVDPVPAGDVTASAGLISPKSAQGAGQVLQQFGSLLEQRRFVEARRLWSDGGRASGLTEVEFAEAYDKYAEIHAEVGAPGTMEGAAGSVYVDVPLRLYGTLKSGRPFNLAGPVTLRRANDVPGSTDEQRRWHIASSGLKPRP